MKYFVGALGVLVILSGAAFILMYAGWYDVAAATPHWDVTTWFLEEVRDRSIAYRSKGIQVPSLKDPKWVKAGFKEYHAMCRQCHGAPGWQRVEFAQGLYPNPPDLTSKEMKGLSERELYWVVKNGIKMTGMPGFGPTHDEEELWSIVAFIKQLPDIQTKEYEAMAGEAEGGKGEKDHHHDSKKH